MRILSIDIGHYSLKAVEVDSAFKRYEIHDYHEIRRAPGESVESILAQLQSKIQKRPDRIVTTLPTGHTTFRNLTLPTKDRRAILSSVGFELEDDLPFNLSDCVYDFSILNSMSASTSLHVSATLKTHMTEFLSAFPTDGLNPDVVTSEAWAFRALVNRCMDKAEQEKPVLFIQMGEHRTLFYAHWNGSPVLCKEIPWGGKTINQHIARIYQIEVTEAEKVKLDSGYILSTDQEGQATEEQKEFSKELLNSCEELLLEIKKTLLSVRGQTKMTAGHIYLSGGTSLLPGLRSAIEKEIKIPTAAFQALSRLSNAGVSYNEQSDASLSLAAASALSLVPLDKTKPIQLRKQEFSKSSESMSWDWSEHRFLVGGTAAVFMSAWISFGVQSYLYDSQMRDLDTRLERNLKDYFGSISRQQIKTHLMEPAKLRVQLQRELQQKKELSQMTGANPQSPLNYLKDLSGQVPRSLVTDLVHFQMGAAPTLPFQLGQSQPVTLTFHVKSTSMAEKLSQIVERTLVQPQRSPIEEIKGDEGEKLFKVSFSGKTREVSHAQ